MNGMRGGVRERVCEWRTILMIYGKRDGEARAYISGGCLICLSRCKVQGRRQHPYQNPSFRVV